LGNWKRIIVLFLVLVCVLGALTGCGDKTKSDSDRVLRIGTTAVNDTFNATTSGGAYGRLNFNAFTQAPFLIADEKGKVLPFFMRSWKFSDDNMSMTFKIPKGVMFHDDEPVTAEDVKYSIDFCVKKGTLLTDKVASCDIIDDETLVLTFSEPSGYSFLVGLANEFAFVWPKHIWENVEDHKTYTGEDSAIGCGPYKLVNVDTDAQISYYEAVDDYFYGDVTVKKVSLHSYSNHDALLMAMKNNEIDAMYDYSKPLPATMANSIIGVENLNPGMSVNKGHNQLTFGFNKAPTNDVSFRKATVYALDWKLIATVTAGEYGNIPGWGVVAPSNVGYDSSIPKLVQDKEKAKSILDEAGYLDVNGDGFREFPDGSPMDVLISPQFSDAKKPLFLRYAEIIANDLKAVGVKTHLDEESVSNQKYSFSFIKSGECELFIGYTTSGIAEFETAYLYMIKGFTDMGWPTCDDPELVALYSKLMSAMSREEYIDTLKVIQNKNVDNVLGLALCWDTVFFPYRTDNFEGWIDYPGYGVINNSTWFNVKPK
jgi:peptide/nickel transport system substrate-binding protein